MSEKSEGVMHQRQTVSPDLKRQNADLDIIRRVAALESFQRDMERTISVQSLAETAAREVELRDRYGRLGLPS